MRHRLGTLLFAIAALILADRAAVAQPSDGNPGAQGWSDQDRQTFYTTSQGSQLIPYAWFRALRRADGDEPFAADQLQRYGYLPNPPSAANPEGLPVGFTLDGTPSSGYLGMTCAACHTTQITYRGMTMRVDGGRASADFQRFLRDLNAALVTTRDTPARFDVFARAIIGPTATAVQRDALQGKFKDWVDAFDSFINASLPDDPWGPGRLDAFGMIFNRVAGFDLHQPVNYRRADAPVRYPFLWDAPKQDKTQWNGAAPNGLYTLGLVRNVGEVFGVFARFDPRRPLLALSVDYDNSADFTNLQNLEELVVKLRPPRWPAAQFGFREDLIPTGQRIFAENCQSCHQQNYAPSLPGACRQDSPFPPVRNTWATPLCDVGTDPRMARNAGGTVTQAGVLRGTTPAPVLAPRLTDSSNYTDLLANAVIGALLRQAADDVFYPDRGIWRAVWLDMDEQTARTSDLGAIVGLEQRKMAWLRQQLQKYNVAKRVTTIAPQYEARVLTGIWAVAPYLHNGSVASLWELLQPAAKRSTSFMVGSREFDPRHVGFVTDSSPFNATFTVNHDNGNSNAGHEYGKDLSDADKWALIEYLKSL